MPHAVRAFLLAACLLTAPAVATAATVTWISDNSGFWDVGANWSTGAPPQAGDDVVIDRPGASVTVTIRAATAAIATLSSTEFLQVDASLTVTGQALIDGGIRIVAPVGGTAAYQLRSPGEWQAGAIGHAGVENGGFVVSPGQTLTLSTNSPKTLRDNDLLNNGQIVWMEGQILLVGASTFTNPSIGLVDAQGDLSVSTELSAGAKVFTNAGTLKKTAGAGIFLVHQSLSFSNTGAVQIETGTFVGPVSGWVNSGALLVSSGATLNLAGATLAAGTALSGAGALTMPGTTTVPGNLTIPLSVTLTGTLHALGTVTMAAAMSWQSGSLTSTSPGVGGLAIQAGQTLTVSAPEATVRNALLVNHGTVNWTAGSIRLDQVSSITNAATGLWNVQGGTGFVGSNNGAEIFTNAGTLQRSGPIGGLTIHTAVTFVNSGVIKIRLGGLLTSEFDRVLSIGPVNLGGTLDVTLINGFAPAFRDTFDVMTYGSRTGQFASIEGHGRDYKGAYGVSVLTLRHSFAPPLTELIRNGDFANGMTNWLKFATPDPSWMSANVVAGVLELFKIGTGNQATVYQETEAAVHANGQLRASFSVRNSSTVRKRLSVLIVDSDFTDLSFCTFWLPANSPFRTYVMRTKTTQEWANAAIYFYAATGGSDGGAYLVDDVSMQHDTGLPIDRTDCVDPTAPAPSGGPDGPNLLDNGDFGTGQLSPWGLFGQITQQIAGGVFEFYRPPAQNQPAGVVLQQTGEVVTPGTLLTAAFQLGNSSAVRKRVTVLVHDATFGDLSACTFWLPPNLPLSNYTIRTFATQAWANATLSIYAATQDLLPWMRLDNVSLRRTPSAALTGTECLEPGGGSDMWMARAKSAAASASRAETAVAFDAGLPPRPEIESRLVADSETLGISEVLDDGSHALTIGREIDLRESSAVKLTFRSWLSAMDARGRVEVARTGGVWETTHIVSVSDTYAPMEVDLSAYAGDLIHLRFVLANAAPADAWPPAIWRIEAIEFVGAERTRPRAR